MNVDTDFMNNTNQKVIDKKSHQLGLAGLGVYIISVKLLNIFDTGTM